MNHKALLLCSLWTLALPLTASAQEVRPESAAPASQPKFSEPILLQAGGKPVRVESPGYAAPSVFDVNGDGHLDLAVGQFSGGKIKIYPGQGQGKFGAGKWLQADGKDAEVPGVW